MDLRAAPSKVAPLVVCGFAQPSAARATRKQVFNQPIDLASPIDIGPQAKNRRRMNGRRHVRHEVGLQQLSTLLGDLEFGPEQGFGRGRAQADQHLGFDQIDLGLQPGQARTNLASIGRLVQPPTAASLPLEVLDHVGDIRVVALDAGALQRLVEQAAGRPHEGLAGDVLAVARHLADQHQASILPTFTKDGLRAALPQWTALAFRRRAAQGGQRAALGW